MRLIENSGRQNFISVSRGITHKRVNFPISRGRAARGRKRVAVVLTDGVSQDSVSAPARRLRATGCEVFALGIGRGYRISQLRQIATDSSHVFTVSFKSLGQVINRIKTKACQRIPSKLNFTNHNVGYLLSAIREVPWTSWSKTCLESYVKHLCLNFTLEM